MWQKWYDSKSMQDLWNMKFHHVLMVEERKEVVRCYRDSEEMRLYNENTIKLIREQDKLHECLLRGDALNKEAIEYLEDRKTVSDLKQALAFYIDLALYAAALPRYIFSFEHERLRPDTEKLAEKLRALSYFPKFVQHVIIPLVEKKLVGAGYDASLANYLTIDEVLAGTFENALERNQAQRFIYEYHNGRESVSFVDDPSETIRELEPDIASASSVSGQTAYPGVVSGTVRIVNTLDLNIPFDNGDILVTISSSPVLMPLIARAGAIVSDEGGLGSHANIIARELKIPCVIGTKNASLVFKDGDTVEVDATSGIVKKL